MTEQPKRSLRLKRNPKYLRSENQLGEKWDFGTARIVQHIPNLIRQNPVTQPMIKVPDSKILCNFINKVNKSYQDYRNKMAQQNINISKKENISKEKKEQGKNETIKKGSSVPKEVKSQYQKKSKQAGKLKIASNISKQSETGNELQNKQKFSQQQLGLGVNMGLNGMYSDSLKKQYDKLQNLYKSATLNSTSQISTGSGQNIAASQFNFHKQPNVGQKLKKQLQKSGNSNQERVFKRSAYHVAIAYHIYLKNLKEREKNGANLQYQIDPTYFARRLKEGKGPGVN